MKKYILVVSMLIIGLSRMAGQVDAGFTTVPVVNGKVVFEQFILTDQELSANQKYAVLQKWVKNKYAGSPLVSGIRFDDKNQSATVSAKTELAGVPEKTVMNYRFDLSVANAGCILVVRDITYQGAPKQGASSFPKVITAEQTITDQAVSALGEEGQMRSSTRKATLSFLNDLYKEVSGLF
ncbi:hypothetical protein [uncultured Proteiniphilum sp.]|uniref:hypothetical protein n=1 Tax=uncultured Proteiniphilum sp. TaxID=497637 RepID=UPI0026279B41|nr:hypothetical protein [uncultured Proteiniphilum sp.]